MTIYLLVLHSTQKFEEPLITVL